MNKKQKALCLAVIFIIIGLAAYPPYNLHGREGIAISLGHAWAFSPPDNGIIDTGLLCIQWLGTCIVGAIAFFLFKDHL